MELVPCDDNARQSLANILFEIDNSGTVNKRSAEYVAKTFPDILLDLARLLTEQATKSARDPNADPAFVIRQQLKPYLMFEYLLGKCPQITGLMYSYFENSSFQPLPEKSFTWVKEELSYAPGFNDELVKQILVSYFKYLTYNPKWFSAVWNWGELGKFICLHKSDDIRYLAACCLSIITKPTRSQHIFFMREVIDEYQALIDLQIKHRHIFDNTFKPCLETKTEMAAEYATHLGLSESGYSFCAESLTKISNILLMKRDTSLEGYSMKALYAKAIKSYIPVASLTDAISKIAYSVAINKPCLIRGSCGSGKTAAIDYIAAHTHRLNPPEYVKVQIGDQIDSKLLIGSYVCTEIPGQFEWQPGPLTKAMAKGSWIVFEDIDCAPADMTQVIHSVLENQNLSCVSCSPIRLDSPHPDFRIFFTQQTRSNKSSSIIGHGFIERLCDIVEIPILDDEDLRQILESMIKPKNLTTIILQLFRTAQNALKALSEESTVRVPTLRDLFKFTHRISSLKPQVSEDKFLNQDLESIFFDSVDCFLASLALPEHFIKLAEQLGGIVNLPSNEVQRLITTRHPEIQQVADTFIVGRAKLALNSSATDKCLSSRSSLAYTKPSLQLMERVSLCVNNREPVLLVGETGVGKTSIVQHIANLMKTDLVVINLSQQSDSSDLLGGYKPVELREVVRPLHDKFNQLFVSTFDKASNKTFLDHVTSCFMHKRKNQWNVYLKLVSRFCVKALNKQLPKDLMDEWKQLQEKSNRLLSRLISKNEFNSMALSFSEGSLIRAVKEGHWILLDEINLAEPDVLQCLLSVLDSLKRSSVYMNNPNDDGKPILIHPNFRIFACMNPSTDIGKKDLTTGTRDRFTEFFVHDIIDKIDVRLIVESYVKASLSSNQIENIVNFYREVKARHRAFTDISGNYPTYSLRTLCRALVVCSSNVCLHMEKSLYESLHITFLQHLDKVSTIQMTKLIEQQVFKKDTSGLSTMAIRMPKDEHVYIEVEGFWIRRSHLEPLYDDRYIITETVKKNLKNLARIISLSQRTLPILIQGHTSVGKTSLIKYLANLTGNKCYRINNHEHTDLQEYVGQYVLRPDGEFAFQEGLLVRAMKKGYWIILDELNLAPGELLEALNRVLDDNRELFIPETRELIKAHSRFMLFATQNPPEEYAGRKFLSRAFRNRFIELHFDETPSKELEYILHRKCEMPLKYAEKIVAVMKELQILRRESGCFNGKSGFMTMRDLFRWGERYSMFKREIPDDLYFDWDEYVASEGLILLEGRVRTKSESDTVKTILEKVFKRQLDRETVYGKEVFPLELFPPEFRHICFIKEFRNLFIQLNHALKYKEPVLLCGQTGCGKTTACQMYAGMMKSKLITYNCHLNTESSDFIGGVRPTRTELKDGTTQQTFPWVDGPLVEAMQSGSVFLMDEISLADDAVLERINSVLEPERSITLTEKDGEEIFAANDFRLVATMNPGGDYGKKELSAALRNRFTEIYCHSTTDMRQILEIVESSLSRPLLKPIIAAKLLRVIRQFLESYYKGVETISIRDIISWCKFISKTTHVAQPRPLSIQESVINGAALVFFDQFGTCGHKSGEIDSDVALKSKHKNYLTKLVEEKFGKEPVHAEKIPACLEINQDIVIFKKFVLNKGPLPIYDVAHGEFVTEAPVVTLNIMKIVRAMQLDRPILLEGEPGAGKTSVVMALAKLTGHEVVRINLSEQTDISDLFGSDLPSTDSENSPSFSWHDGPMLSAIKKSQWILLDEMNLASQSVLEGLNACLDHRGEIFIPELNKKILVDRSSSRIFACQNPYSQGAARKGLPQSFLNRFTSIYIEKHSVQDLLIIIERLYPSLPADLVEKIVTYNNAVQLLPSIYSYSNCEFNLRDIIYWCDLLTKYVRGNHFKDLKLYKPDRFVQFVYLDRMRIPDQRLEATELFETVFGCPPYEPPYRDIRLGEHSFMIARSILPRRIRPPPQLPELCILKYQLPFIESIAKAIEHNKMPIIVGESGVGKRTMVRILAGLTGNELNIMGANREMDTVELLGSYEQKNVQREIVDLIEEAKDCVMTIQNSVSQKQFASTWREFFVRIWAVLYSTSSRDLEMSRNDLFTAYHFQLNQMKELIEKIQPLSDHRTEEQCLHLLKRINKLLDLSSNQDSLYACGYFEWIDSILIKSIREGSWLLIEDANLMNPATLDRLNSLVESNGSLSLNEKGSGSNGIETLVPHPNFRLILTMDPENGELSRAMRNRGVEIFVQTKFYFEDFLMLLNHSGFEQEDKKTCMAYCIMQTSYDTHKRITGEDNDEEGSLSILAYFALNYITSLTHQVRRKVKIDEILADLLIAFYAQRGFIEQCSDQNLRSDILDKMQMYRKTYEVNLIDERYKWMHLRHDLPSLTGGDAAIAMAERDNRIFFDDFSIDLLLKPEEMIDNIDIVNTCITVKIFLELSTHGDFEYRKGFIRENFAAYEKMMNTIKSHIELLHSEYLPIINRLLPRSELTPVSDLYVDSRNSSDLHYYLQSLDYVGTEKREYDQNRWLLSLHRIMLRMIVELAEERSMTVPNNTSLWNLSEKVRAGKMLKEDLVRPNAELVSDLFDLFDGILRVVGNRCFDNKTVVKMIPRFFWISYFICKLKRGHNKAELIAICNQIPMLWALTYQKVIVPLIKDCGMADLIYKNRKFSARIQHICDFLDITLSKPGNIEKSYYKKVYNLFASTTKQAEIVQREVDKLFASLIGRYTSRANSLSSTNDQNQETLAASGVVWSTSSYLKPLYDIEEQLLLVENADSFTEDSNINIAKVYEDAKICVQQTRSNYEFHETWLNEDKYRSKCLNTNRRLTALDQFAPIWQQNFIHIRFAKISHQNIPDPGAYHQTIKSLLTSVSGIILSPKYYATLIRYLRKLGDRVNHSDSDGEDSNETPDYSRENLDMYSTFILDHMLENFVLDHQIVGWTKLRVSTSNLPAIAPLMPEYTAILSLVGSYCLDITHLKLNSYLDSNTQLNSILLHMWRSYIPIKLNQHKDLQDLELAQNLIHLQAESGLKEELVGSYECEGKSSCQCIDIYIQRRLGTFNKLLELIKTKCEQSDVDDALKAIRLIYFGYLNYLENAPLFTLDPSLRSREKLEVYRAELAHIKLELQFRNTLFYWKTGENLLLNEIDAEGASLYPYSIRILIDRRIKLEKSISRLAKEHFNRPKSDDGSLYYELRREIEVTIERYTNSIHSLVNEFGGYISCKDVKIKATKFSNLIARCRMLIKSIEKSTLRLKSEYSLYSDLITNFQVGMCFVQQGLRCLYANLEQKLQIRELGCGYSVDRYLCEINRIFSFNDYTRGNIELVHKKLEFFSRIDKICPQDEASKIQSILLKTVLIQLNHHIVITPSDIKKCIPIVRLIADRFHTAWLQRKLYLEDQRKQKEELYQYKTSRTTLGTEISYERQEFLDICSKFPTYDHIYISHFSMPPTSADKENLETEEKMNNLNRSVDLSMCIDICKAHYKFIREASRNLLQQIDLRQPSELPNINLSQMIQLEAETLFTIIRHCISTLDQRFDSMSLECHFLQANQMIETLKKKANQKISDLGSLKSSIEILDQEIFDIYHSGNATEALRFQEFITKLDQRIKVLRNNVARSYDSHPTLHAIIKLITKISSFLITDPMMKFVTGSHTVLEKLDEWNQQSISMEDKMISESFELVDLIKSWRSLEIESWKSTLHIVKRKFIDGSLCDLWFRLYEAFTNPIVWVRNLLRDKMGNEDFVLDEENQELLYQGFVLFIKEFFEDSTLGDYQIRLDLVFSFALQTRFASLYEQAQPNYSKTTLMKEKNLKVDFEKLFIYVYNTHRQYQGLFEPIKEIVEMEERKLTQELNSEIRIVAWQGRNLYEIKKNFRISHRKLNKVMNKYLDVLRKPLPGLRPIVNIPEKSLSDDSGPNDIGSERISAILVTTKLIIDMIPTPTLGPMNLSSLKKASKVIQVLKDINNNFHQPLTSRFINNLSTIEDAISNNYDSIQNFRSHKVQEVIIEANESKESKLEKQKLCRQMYHSKKFSLQSIFKSLQQLGVSYQRGLNSQELLDQNVLSLEPLRGMIQNQSRAVLKASTELVDDTVITMCNDKYRKLIACNMYLLAQPSGEDLSSDQMNRIRGYSLDMILDIISHNRSAALIYRHLMDIQAAATRLSSLKKQSEGESTLIYNFSTVHKVIKKFNELVSRAYLTMLKLEKLAECCSVALQVQNSSSTGDGEANKLSVGTIAEGDILKELICEVGEENSMMTQEQLDHINSNFSSVRKVVTEISDHLRDMLNHTTRNHIYSRDDMDHLKQLYDKFVEAFSLFVFDEAPNTKEGTVLGSLKSLLDEAESMIKPELNRISTNSGVANVLDHPNVKNLNIRLHKLLKHIMLAIQELNNEEMEYQKLGSSNFESLGSSSIRKHKPFNYVDSLKIKNLLRLSQVSKYVGDCFITLNRETLNCDIYLLVNSLAPILSIYTQDVSIYLNIIMTSLHLKLTSACQLIPFFTDIVTSGFGLPIKMSSEEGGEQTKGKQSEDNTGFGEGKGDEDVSKKLEFESQLDDLKTDENEETEKREEDSTVPAHDDGIEMSEDIGGKAEGAGSEDEKDEKNQDDVDDDDLHENLNELEKELDDVDKDEGQLDEKLWGKDEDKPEDEDVDDEDLKETDVDQSSKPDVDSTDMAAKDDKLSESKKDDKVDESNEKDDTDDCDVDMSDQTVDPLNVDDDNLDLEKEANEALQEVKEPPQEKSTNEELLDMSISEDEAKDRDDDEAGKDDAGHEIDVEGSDAKSDGEISSANDDLEEPADGADEMATNTQNSLNDSDIDQRLDEIARNPQLDEKLEDRIEEAIRNLPANSDNQGTQNSAQQMEGRKVGSHTIYNIIEESDDDPLDFDESYHPELDQTNMIHNQKNQANQRNPEDDQRLDVEEVKDVSANDEKADETSQPDDKDKQVMEEKKKETKSKRTFAEHDDEDNIDNIKRRKILDAIEDSKEDDEQNQKVDEKPNNDDKSTKFRHTTTNSEKAPEVIDLVSSSGDDSEEEANKHTLKDVKSIDLEEEEQKSSEEHNKDLMEEIDNELNKKSIPEQDSVDADKLIRLWLECTRNTSHLVHELCQQLQIVLQPTKMSKYKGDYKSGKRLNMRKIISYIASHYRKDKIWLRRTKPSKRTYNITLAVDNSSSMSENNCRQMTYQSLALLAKSLSLIEAGSLSVVSFGEQVRCIHEFDQPYMDAIGAQWLKDLRFNESRTSYKLLLKYSCEAFAKQAQATQTKLSLDSPVSQLLIILSDGRNVSSEEEELKIYLRTLKGMGVLTLFIIIDDLKLNEGKSLVDVKRCVGFGGNVQMVNYMELFPFQFYVLLHQLESMPLTLGSSLRQWFELVSTS